MVYVVSAVRRNVPALGDQSPQQGASGRLSGEQGTCARLGGRHAGASADHDGEAVRQGANDTAHVLRDATDLVVIGSNGGADRSPDWSLNLRQTPRAVVEIGTDKLVVTARPASQQERERLWVVITATYASYARYQERTSDGSGGASHTRGPRRSSWPLLVTGSGAPYDASF